MPGQELTAEMQASLMTALLQLRSSAGVKEPWRRLILSTGRTRPSV